MSGMGYECPICRAFSPDGRMHAEDCPNHPDARLIALERRVRELERRLDEDTEAGGAA